MLVLRLMRLIYMDCTKSREDCVDVRYVEEATQVFEIRVQACQQRHEDHLHVYCPPIKRKELTYVGLWGKECTH